MYIVCTILSLSGDKKLKAVKHVQGTALVAEMPGGSEGMKHWV